MKPNLNQLLKQAQEMQANMQKVQEKLANIVVEGSSGGGMVTVSANCQNQILSVTIEPEVIDPTDKEMLEELITAAVNQALENASKRSQEEMSQAAGPMLGNMPGGFKIPGM